MASKKVVFFESRARFIVKSYWPVFFLKKGTQGNGYFDPFSQLHFLGHLPWKQCDQIFLERFCLASGLECAQGRKFAVDLGNPTAAWQWFWCKVCSLVAQEECESRTGTRRKSREKKWRWKQIMKLGRKRNPKTTHNAFFLGACRQCDFFFFFLHHFHVPATACADDQRSGIVYMWNLHSAWVSTSVAKWIAKSWLCM